MEQTILIADDEPLARRTLVTHLRELGCRGVIHEASDGRRAITLANEQRPELIFLDIVMPGATGLQVLERLEWEANVIFTTAHDEYAVSAFELGALDYVLKPFGRDRLERAIQRARGIVNSLSVPVLSRAKEVLQAARTLSRIFVRDGNRIVPVPLASIERVEAADDYATIVATAKHYLVSIRLTDLETHLAGTSFVRIHRSHLINLDHVASIQPCDAGRLQVSMNSGTQMSRAGSKRIRDMAY